MSGFFGTIGNAGSLKENNEELRFQNQELLAETAVLKELEKENEFLREALGISLSEDFGLILASLTGKDISEDSIFIDKGLEDGILKEMPAISQQKVLLGRVGEVYGSFSRVDLISFKESSFDAKVSGKEIYGLVKGLGQFKVLLDLIPQEKEILEGDFVVSSSLGGIFPQGLLVGSIGKVKNSDVRPFQEAEINPAFDIGGIKRLFIISDF